MALVAQPSATFTPMHGSRIFGLDLMRAAAILLVVFWHNADVLARFVPVPSRPVIDGVDLFFVLSGYLIGGILLRYAAMQEVSWRRRLLDFWQRRWLRTLPNYYLFLLINIALVHFGVAHGLLNHNLWGYFLFLQDAWKNVDLFFWESWSLVVEEWYYLLFPLLLFAALGVARDRPRAAFLVVALGLVVFSTLVRLRMVGAYGSVFELESAARKLAITRFDTIGFGMLAVWAESVVHKQWRTWRLPLATIGMAGILLCAFAYGNANLWFTTRLYFTLNAISMAMLLPALSQWRTVPRWGRPVVFISLVSYALYLVHQPLRATYAWLYEGCGAVQGISLYLLFWVLSLVLSWLVYRFWERPFMAWREPLSRRLIPSS